jgi:WD40 repeat protein
MLSSRLPSTIRIAGLGALLVAAFAANCHSQGPITAIAITPEGTHAVFGSQRGMEIRTWPDMALVKPWPTKLVHVHDLQFSPDGKRLLAAGGSPADIGEMEVWTWPEGQLLHRISDHSDVVYRAAWSTDGTRFASCSGDASCFIYGSEACEKQAQYSGHSGPVLAIRWLDGSALVSVGVDQTVRLWECETGTHIRTLDNHLAGVNDVAVRPVIASFDYDGDKAVIATVAEDRTLRLWQPRIGRLMRFARLESVPRCVIWTADASQLVVGCNDGRVRIFDWENMESVTEIETGVGRAYEIALNSVAGELLVAGENGCFRQPVEATRRAPSDRFP